MSARLENNSSAPRPQRRQPLWPWLLMPLATLAIFLALRNARQQSPHVTAAPDEAAETAVPGSGSG